jgi:hypothetical protein
MSENAPPENVRQAAAVVSAYLTEQETRKLSDEEFAKLTPRERIEYCRRFDQGQFTRKGDR